MSAPIVTTDIRGVARPAGSAYDIGVVEGAGGDAVSGAGSGTPTPSGSFIPVGSLGFSDFGAAAMQFLAPDGTNLGTPASNPTTQSGPSGLVAFSSGQYWDGLNIFDSSWNILSSVAGVSRGAAADGVGHVYGIIVTPGLPTYTLVQYNTAGSQTGSWVVHTGAVTRDAVGVNAAGTIAYLAARNGDTIFGYDLVGNASLGTFTTETGSVVEDNGILVLASGDVLIGWSIPGTSSYVKRYSSGGSLLATYTISGGFGQVACLTLSTSTSFFASYADHSAYGTGLIEVRIGDGAVLHQFSPPNTGFGWDGPFVVTGVVIGTPVSSPPPAGAPGGGGGSVAIPQVPCQPQTIISTPSRASGCNQGGVGSVPSYTGPSGSVPIGANPIDGMPLTGQRSVYVWAEMTHTLYA